MKKNLTLVLLCLICSVSVFAQRKLSGTVFDTDANPVVGASVFEKGTNNGTVTDMNGNFSISVSPSSILQITHLGYEPVEINVGNRTMIEITLDQLMLPMDEIIVIGYGTIKKADLSGAVANVSGEKLSSVRGAASLSQAMQGTMPGVTVTRTNSMPGAAATIRVRGITTIGDSDPLIIVDGVPGDLSMNVDDIESISVLKDAASASIYGARAAAGVILVTTKRAKEGNLNIEYSGNLGWVMPAAFPQTVDYKRYMEITNEINWNDGGNLPGSEHTVYSQEYIDGYYENHLYDPDRFPITDWTSYLIKDSAPTTKHNISMAYGSNIAHTKASLGYESTEGLYANRSYAAVTARVNNDVKISKWLSASVDGSYLRGINKNPVVNPINAGYLYAPLWAPVYSDGRISGGRDGTNTYARANYGGFNDSWNDRISGKFAINFTPIDDLTITAVYAPNISINRGKNMVQQLPYYSLEDPNLFVGYIAGCEENKLTETRSESRGITKQLLANYSFSIQNAHNFHLMAGYEDYYYRYEYLSANSEGMELSSFPYLNLANKDNTTVGGYAVENSYMSYFGRITYDYMNKYLFQANIRSDYSSRFHRDYRTGIYPSVSAGWVLTEENFMDGVDKSILSFLKLRGSWGSLGNERIGDYPYQSIIAFNNALFTGADGSLSTLQTASLEGYNMNDITWETTGTWNVGLDLTLFDNRLTMTADYYKKKTSGMLLELTIPEYMGYTYPEYNVGEMHTTGWDLVLGWRDRKGDFSYGVSINLSDYKSIMGDLSGRVVYGTGTIIREGTYYQEWYGYLSDGLFLTQEDRDSSPRISENTVVGDVKYLDISGPDGVPDGIISSEYDRVPLGNSQPRYQYGASLDMQYKGFDFNVIFQGVGKRTVWVTSNMTWRSSAWHTFPGFIDGNYFSYYNTDEQNANAKYPRVSEKGYSGNNYDMSDFWLINGAYFRLKNIVLGYTLPQKAAKWLHVSNARVYVSGTDLFSIDNFPEGWDPEVSTAGSAYITRSYNIGLSVKF